MAYKIDTISSRSLKKQQANLANARLAPDQKLSIITLDRASKIRRVAIVVDDDGGGDDSHSFR